MSGRAQRALARRDLIMTPAPCRENASSLVNLSKHPVVVLGNASLDRRLSNEEQTADISNGRMQGKTMVSLSTEPRAFHASAYKLAWGAALIFYFLEYVVRSAPAVMIPALTTAF